MQFKPEWLYLPEYIAEEIHECQMRVEQGVFETGLIVDANNLMYRLAFAASKDVNGAEDMLALFIEKVRLTAKDIGADLVVCCIDHGVSLRRSMLGAKKKPDKTPEQQAVIDMAREALRILRVPAIGYEWLNPLFIEGYEADDICAAMAVSGLCIHTVLYSTDSDLYQVTNGRGITQLSPDTGRFLVSEVPQHLVPGLKALAGDASDNIDGLKGVGPKTALELLTGKKTREMTLEEVRQVRNDITLTALPFPGSFQCLEGVGFVRADLSDPVVYTDTVDDSEGLPF